MAETVFFSWQIDTPTDTGRNFIERALERAIGRLNDAVELEEPERESLALDRDTKGVAGQPPIVDTIFKKIDGATVFVPDLTFVGLRADGRPTPNPNVLIEYGWALKSLSHGRIVPVMNVAHGEPDSDSMPFDMRHLRFPITYNLPPDAAEELRKARREKFAKELEGALRAVIEEHGLATGVAKVAAKPFPAVEPISGPARFRPSGAALGIRDMRLPGMPSGEIRLQDGSAVWLRVMPAHDPERTWTTTELRTAGVEGGRSFLGPLVSAYGGLTYLRADDGFGVFRTGEGNSTDTVTFAFETGEVWSIDSRVVPTSKHASDERSNAGVPIFEDEFRNGLARFSAFLEQLGLKRPFRWIAGMEGVRGCGLYYEPAPGYERRVPGPAGTCVADVISAEGMFLEGESSGHALKPFFVKVFSKFGLDRRDYPADSNTEVDAR